MLEKILVPVIFIAAQFIIAWYGNFSGKFPIKGVYMGLAYDSAFIRALITQFEYLWLLIIINLLFSFGFNLGFNSYKDFLIIAIVWIASGPIAALLFNTLVTKEKVDLPIIIGIILVTLGTISVMAHKEITKMIS